MNDPVFMQIGYYVKANGKSKAAKQPVRLRSPPGSAATPWVSGP